jgi:hypothetical protein
MQNKTWLFKTTDVNDYKTFESAALASGYHWVDGRIREFSCPGKSSYYFGVYPDKGLNYFRSTLLGEFNNLGNYAIVDDLKAALYILQVGVDKATSVATSILNLLSQWRDEETRKQAVPSTSDDQSGEWFFRAVNQEESCKFQEMAFKHGYSWCGSGKSVYFPCDGVYAIHVFPESKILGWKDGNDFQTVPSKTLNKAKFWFEAQPAAPESFWIYVINAIASEAVQRIAFSHGYSWGTGSKEYNDLYKSWLRFEPDTKAIRLEDGALTKNLIPRILGADANLDDWIKIFNNPPKAPPISYCFNDHITLHGDGRLETKGNCILSRERVQELFNQWSNI